MKVRININSVVLNGFRRWDAAELGRSLEQELSRFVKENGISRNISGTYTLDARVLNIPQGAKAELAGSQIARSIFEIFETK